MSYTNQGLQNYCKKVDKNWIFSLFIGSHVQVVLIWLKCPLGERFFACVYPAKKMLREKE